MEPSNDPANIWRAERSAGTFNLWQFKLSNLTTYNDVTPTYLLGVMTYNDLTIEFNDNHVFLRNLFMVKTCSWSRSQLGQV